MKQVIYFLSVLLLVGCSSLPQELKSTQATTLVEYNAFSDAANAGEKAEVRLGGVIARLDNLSDQTRIEIVNLPISSVGKPDISEEPNGRFVVYVNGFIDPVTYAKGRLITVIGQADGIEQANVGEFVYPFPVIQASAIHLWQIQEYVVTNDLDMSYMPCAGARCFHQRSHLETRRGKVVQEVK
ncbi:Slp family lipoprotein [Aliivibrio fischeri]|uniref:Outer membrane protein Slp n=1 Tax=Aliivibrio fischeri (strain MJ11) TaxID=388396 RepID=B5FFQ1_ALIFM|nr:Slp family lipoprotein [Aliivibrio fischeri]ACH67108.1 outer membrane protein Slp [Aliivibrio fischeri MJ11]MCE4934760.1 Slp family lipoprotein [Aliivibrio fischeri]MUH97850.1 Slp family lipoprotein [Aliivibrio fischeri]MUI63299.1 Slp family lipoprotein [Aliivibrio fischeri]OCH04707.1 starvation-inducible protein [Aliivibrio fischeri]